MIEGENKASVLRPSPAVETTNAGDDGTLSSFISIVLDALRPISASQRASVRFRLSGHEFREADYNQIRLWANDLNSAPGKIVQTLKATTADIFYLVDAGSPVEAGKIGFRVKDGSITSLVWDLDALPQNEFVWVKDLQVREIAFIGPWNIRFAPTFSYKLPTLLKLVCSELGMRGQLELSNFPHLTHLYCEENKLTEIDLTCLPELVELNCSRNELASLDLSRVPKLEKLRCDENPLTELELANVPRLYELRCCYGELTELNLSNLPKLAILSCWNNPLKNLDLSNVPELADLCCSGNQLEVLDLSNVPKLTDLICGCNELTSVDLSKVSALVKLTCERNQLTELDLSAVPRLTELHCSENLLTELDPMSKSTAQNLGTTPTFYCGVSTADRSAILFALVEAR